MAGEVEFDPLTIRHIVGVPNALLNAPAISAMHAIRARRLLQSDAADGLPRLHGMSHLDETGRCPSCGALRIGSTRVQRSRPNKGTTSKARVVRWACSICHFVLETPISPSPGRIQHPVKRRSHGAAAVLEGSGNNTVANTDSSGFNVICAHQSTNVEGDRMTRLQGRHQDAQAHLIVKPSHSIVATATTTGPLNPGNSVSLPPGGPPAKAKSRPKNKSSLQALLAQNRKREAENAAAKSQTGLGAFLDSL